MIDIRPATADDLPRIEQIYDAIHTAEETGAASIGWARGVYRHARPRRQRSTMGHCSCSRMMAFSSPPGASTKCRCRSTRRCRGNTQRRRSRCSCCTRSSLTRRSPGTATARSSCAFMPGAPARLGCTVLRIDTECKNAAARRLYARLGFREAAIVPYTFNGIAGVDSSVWKNGWTQNDTKAKKTAARGHIPRAAVIYKTRYWRSSSTRCAPTRRTVLRTGVLAARAQVAPDALRPRRRQQCRTAGDIRIPASHHLAPGKERRTERCAPRAAAMRPVRRVNGDRAAVPARAVRAAVHAAGERIGEQRRALERLPVRRDMRRRALKTEPMHARIDDRCGKAPHCASRAVPRAHTLPIDLRAEAPHPERNIAQLAHADTAADKMLERVQKQKDQMVARIGHAQRHAAGLPSPAPAASGRAAAH